MKAPFNLFLSPYKWHFPLNVLYYVLHTEVSKITGGKMNFNRAVIKVGSALVAPTKNRLQRTIHLSNCTIHYQMPTTRQRNYSCFFRRCCRWPQLNSPRQSKIIRRNEKSHVERWSNANDG